MNIMCQFAVRSKLCSRLFNETYITCNPITNLRAVKFSHKIITNIRNYIFWTPDFIGPINCGRHGPTSSPPLSVLRPDQKRWAQMLTARHWSGFFSSLEAARAHWVRRGSWFSSLKHRERSNVPMIRVMAASWAFESLISSSYRENALGHTHAKIKSLF